MGKIYRGLFDEKEQVVPVNASKKVEKEDVEKIEPLSTKSKIFKDAKKLLNNYVLLCKQVESVEKIISERYKTVFVDAKIEDMTAEEIAEMMTTKNEFTHSEVKLLEMRRSYLKTKYMVQLIDNALEALKERYGDLQYEVVLQLGILCVRMDDIEDVMASKGCNMSESTCYRTFVKGVSNFAVLLWGYDVIKDELTETVMSGFQTSLYDFVEDVA